VIKLLPHQAPPTVHRFNVLLHETAETRDRTIYGSDVYVFQISRGRRARDHQYFSDSLANPVKEMK